MVLGAPMNVWIQSAFFVINVINVIHGRYVKLVLVIQCRF